MALLQHKTLAAFREFTNQQQRQSPVNSTVDLQKKTMMNSTLVRQKEPNSLGIEDREREKEREREREKNLSTHVEIALHSLQQKYDELLGQKHILEEKLAQKQLWMEKKENSYKNEISRLRERIQNEPVSLSSKLLQLRGLHSTIQDTVSSIQSKTEGVLRDQEKDLLRSFRARLADMSEELERCRKQSENGSAEWVAKYKQATDEVEWLRKEKEDWNTAKKHFVSEISSLKRQVVQQEADREHLFKQLVAVKKELARVSRQHEKGGVDRKESKSPGESSTLEKNHSVPELHSGKGDVSSPSRAKSSQALISAVAEEARYKSVIARQQRQIEEDQARIRRLQTALNEEAQSRSQLQAIFKKSLEEAQLKFGKSSPRRLNGIATPDTLLSPAEKIGALESFVANDQVKQLLIDGVFPSRKNLHDLEKQLGRTSPLQADSNGDEVVSEARRRIHSAGDNLNVNRRAQAERIQSQTPSF